MEPSRKDVKIHHKKWAKCKNSSWIGYSTGNLKPGDFFVYEEPMSRRLIFGKSHGMVSPSMAEPYKYIFAQVLFPNHTFTGERWVDPDWVREVVPADRAPEPLKELFLELEENQK